MSECGGKEVRVVLYSDQPVLVAGLQSMIGTAPDIRLAAACSTLEDFKGCLEGSGAAVALVDAPPQLDLASIVDLTRRANGCRIVLWVHSVNVHLAYDLRESGVAGILRKQLSQELTIRCLRKVAAGETWFERELMSSLLEARPVKLGPREKQLVDLVCRGHSNKQIAGLLNISEGTVKVYFSKLFRKLGVSDRLELALFGLQHQRLDEAPTDRRRMQPILLGLPARNRQSAA